MKRYFAAGLGKHERKILDELGCGNYSLAGMRANPKAVEKLVAKGLIHPAGRKVVCRDRFGEVSVPEYAMPIHVHIAWSEWMAGQAESEGGGG